jgi:hypothetical protein
MTERAGEAFQAQMEAALGSEYLYPTPCKQGQWPYRTRLQHVWARTLRRAEVPYFPLYHLRHTFATRLSAGGGGGSLRYADAPRRSSGRNCPSANRHEAAADAQDGLGFRQPECQGAHGNCWVPRSQVLQRRLCVHAFCCFKYPTVPNLGANNLLTCFSVTASKSATKAWSDCAAGEFYLSWTGIERATRPPHDEPPESPRQAQLKSNRSLTPFIQ